MTEPSPVAGTAFGRSSVFDPGTGLAVVQAQAHGKPRREARNAGKRMAGAIEHKGKAALQHALVGATGQHRARLLQAAAAVLQDLLQRPVQSPRRICQPLTIARDTLRRAHEARDCLLQPLLSRLQADGERVVEPLRPVVQPLARECQQPDRLRQSTRGRRQPRTTFLQRTAEGADLPAGQAKNAGDQLRADRHGEFGRGRGCRCP